MISNELLEEVIYISSNGKFIDENLITKIIMDVVNKTDDVTKNLLSNIEFCEINIKGSYAVCNIETGHMKVDLLNFIEFQKSQKRSSILICNLEILQILLHEIKHLQSEYIMSLNNIESKLIEISSYDYIYKRCYKIAKQYTNNFIEANKLAKRKYADFRYDNFEIIPDERLAEADSFEALINSVNNYPDFKIDYLNAFKFLCNQYKKVICQGYEYRLGENSYSSPLIKYLIAIGRVDLLKYLGLSLKPKKATIKLDDDIVTKMKYGLPLTSIEYHSLDKVLNKKLTRSTK